MRVNARTIIRDARAADIDPVEHTLDLADGYGWDEDMADEAVATVQAYVELHELATASTQ